VADRTHAAITTLIVVNLPVCRLAIYLRIAIVPELEQSGNPRSTYRHKPRLRSSIGSILMSNNTVPRLWILLLAIVSLPVRAMTNTEAASGTLTEASSKTQTTPSPSTEQNLSIGDVLKMTGAEASKGFNVQAEGVLVYVDPVRREGLFKDSTGAIRVPIDLTRNRVQPGTSVLLRGKTGAEIIRYPDHPSGSQYLNSFDAPMNVDDLYFARVHGFVHPPRTGEYTFWIASDNGSELWLSSDDNPKNTRKIAMVGDLFNYTPAHGWDKMPSQHSEKILLQAGKKYYIEALHWEQFGEDFLAVAWDGPGISRSVIPGSFLSAPGTETHPAERGSILREFWLSYPCVDNAEASAWGTNYGKATIEAMIGNPPTHYGQPLIVQADLTPLKDQALPALRPIELEQPWTQQDDFRPVEVEGVISQIASDGSYWAVLDLIDKDRQMIVRLPNPGPEKLQRFLNARAVIRGFCEGAFSADGQRRASVLWVCSPLDISLRDPVNDDWPRLPIASLRDLEFMNATVKSGERVRIKGRVVEQKPGEPLLFCDTVSRFTAFVSTNGQDWLQVGESIEIPMNYSASAGIATYAPTGLCTATYNLTEAVRSLQTETNVGNPPTSIRTRANPDSLVITGTGNIGGRSGFDTTVKDSFNFLYRPLNGDAEAVVKLESLVPDVGGWQGAASGLMFRETMDPDSRFAFLAVSTNSGVDFRIRRGKGNPIQSFPDGMRPPCWLKLTRQSAPPIRVYANHDQKFQPDQAIEVAGILERTNREWIVTDASCRSTQAEAPKIQTEITTVQQLRELSADELKEAPPVRIQGVITARAGDLFLQDDSGGIRIPSMASQKLANCQPGQHVSVIGRCVAGDCSPQLEPGQQSEAVNLLGTGTMPKPLAQNWSQLMSGKQDAQWVEVKGVIRKIQQRTLKLQMPGGDVFINLGFDLQDDYARALVDSTVRIQGVCEVRSNDKKQLTDVRLIVPAAEFVIVDDAAPEDPFAVSSQSISQLLQSGDRSELIHRTKIEGVVTCIRESTCYVEDATGGIEVTTDHALLREGDRVEVIGFPTSNGSSINLNDSLVRTTGTGSLPKPARLDPGTLPQPMHASRLLAMKTVFLGRSVLLNNQVLQLQINGRVFQGTLPNDRGTLPDLELGSLLDVKGVCRMVNARTPQSSESDADFEILLSSPEDVVLLQAPPWWNWRRLLWIGGIFVGVLAIAVTWIAMISRKNRLLKLAQQELRKANEELEIRVEHRTADLAKANTKLGHEQALFRALLDNASDNIYFKDADSRFVRCSLSLCNRSGLTQDQMVGKTDFDIFQAEYARLALDDEQQILHTGQPLIGKLEQEIHPDGRITWVMTTKMPWRDPQGKIIGTFGISRDITSIKEAEAKLEQVHQQLVDASRAAGQAEVAASVLHNVGNVLNSVNVSVGIIEAQLRKSKIDSNLARVTELLMEHQQDLGRFFTQDPRAPKVPPFLKALSEQIASQKAQLLGEIEALTRNVDHVKEVVSMQQSYARVSGITGTQSIPALIEDALRVHTAALESQHVRVVRSFEPVPEIAVDKHRVLQILVNLISNAKWALSNGAVPDPVLTLGIQLNSDNRLRISVADNGVGISPENLDRLFRHGFTTRTEGQGYGLHTSILAAREMGGNLVAASDGLNCGAVFTLELPCEPKAAATDEHSERNGGE
jgi:PAS domain S-box-containing protein